MHILFSVHRIARLSSATDFRFWTLLDEKDGWAELPVDTVAQAICHENGKMM